MAAGRLYDFYEILAFGVGCGGVFHCNSLKLRITVQPVMPKAKVVDLTIIFIVITVFSPNHTHLINVSVTAVWNSGHG